MLVFLLPRRQGRRFTWEGALWAVSRDSDSPIQQATEPIRDRYDAFIRL